MNKKVIASWVMSAMFSAFMLFSAMGKFTSWEGKEVMFSKMGWTLSAMTKIGIAEALLAILFLVPRISFFVAILLTAYLGGAVATHVRIGEAFFFPILIGFFMWIALGLRNQSVFDLAKGKVIKR